MGFIANLTDILEGNENVNQKNITVAGRIKNMYGPTFIDDWRIILTLCDIHNERVEFEIKIYLRNDLLNNFVTLTLGDIVILTRCIRERRKSLILSSQRSGSSNVPIYVISADTKSDTPFIRAFMNRSRLVTKTLNKFKFNKLKKTEELQNIENSFIHIDEDMESWWNSVAPHLNQRITFMDSRRHTEVYAYQGIITDLIQVDNIAAKTQEYLMLVKIVRTTEQIENSMEMIYADEKKLFLTYCYRHLDKQKEIKITSHKVPELLKSFRIKDGIYYRLKVEIRFSHFR